VVDEFLRFCLQEDTLLRRVVETANSDPLDFTVDGYIRYVAASDLPKSIKYRTAWERFLRGERKDITYKVVAKTGEYFNLAPGKNAESLSNRARCIFDPEDIVKVFGGWYA